MDYSRLTSANRTAAEVVVDQLVALGVRHIFRVPGESYLAVLDALLDRPIDLTVCRHETGCAIMAEAILKRRDVRAYALSPTALARPTRCTQQGSSPMIGGFGATVVTTADFSKAFKAARASGLSSILRLRIDHYAISLGATLAPICSQALERTRSDAAALEP